jgi:hypothetical protein
MKRRVGPDTHGRASLFAKITRLFEPLQFCSWLALAVVTLSSIRLGERNLPTVEDRKCISSFRAAPRSKSSILRPILPRAILAEYGVQVGERQNVAGQKRA